MPANPKNNQEMIQHKMLQVEENFGHQDFFNRYILDTLDSFGYRYLDRPQKAELLTLNMMRVVALEEGIKEAIKIKNPELRAGIGELVKRVSKAQGPTIQREIRVNIIERDPARGGVCQVWARISFGHPEHDYRAGTYVEKLSTLNFEDDLHFRNALAKHLEIVSELF